MLLLRHSRSTSIPNTKQCRFLSSLIIIILAVAVSLLTPLPVQAKSFSLSISPPVTEVITRPGTTIKLPFTVTNQSETAEFTILPQLFTAQDQLGHTQPTSRKSPALTWLTVTEPKNRFHPKTGTYTLPTGQAVKFVLTLKIPANAPDADHQLAIFWQSVNPDIISGSSHSGSLSLGRVASLILLTVSSSPTINSSAAITQFSLPRLVDSFTPLSPTLLVSNTGPHFTKLTGTLTLKNSLTHSKFLTALAPTNILAHSNRYLLASPSAQLAAAASPTSPLSRLLALLTPSSSTPSAIRLQHPPILFGPYTLTADLHPVDAAGQLNATHSFLALPYKLVAFLILLFLVIRSVLKKIASSLSTP